MAQALKVPGRAVGETDEFRADAQELAFDDGLRVELRDEVHVDPAARSEAAQVHVDGDERDVVEIVHSDGYVDFKSFRQLQESSERDRGEASPGDVNLLRALEAELGPATRGDRSTLDKVRRYGVQFPAQIAQDIGLLEGVKGIVDRAVDPLVREAARRVIRWVERPAPDTALPEERRKRPKTPGLYQVTFDLHLEPGNRLTKPPDRIDDPYLLFVHGTQSHTENAFGALAGTDEWGRLFDRYGGNVLAFEHPTLSLSPFENALALAESLPERALLHLVTHSRGGLVGDALSVAAGGDPDVRVLERSHRDQAEIALVHKLFSTMSERGVAIERYVRAGCPASGTLLASRRLDQYAKWLLWAVSKFPLLAGVGAVLKTLILSILEVRMQTDVAPGLEAQMPESAFIRWLNTNRKPLDDDLGVLAADVEGRGIKGRAKVAAADLFYREDHDYVVNTRAMYQGARRGQAHYSFHKGQEATHFTYFADAGTRLQLESWLLRDGKEPAEGFATVDRDARELAPTRHRGAPGAAPMVVPVAAFMGNALLRGEDPVWPVPEVLATEGVGVLGSTEEGLVPGEPLARSYQPLADGLGAAGLDLMPFGWDWRLGLDAAAERLAGHLETLASEHATQSIHVLGHSTGGLVALLWAARHAEQWEALRERGGRLVLVGCPTEGTHRALQLAAGEDELAQLVAVADPGPDDSIAYVFRNYPAVAASLPGPLDAPWWLEEWWWATFGEAPDDGKLAAAQSIRAELAAAGRPPGAYFVAGTGVPTPVEFVKEDTRFRARADGDGVAPVASTVPRDGGGYIAEGVAHGALVADPGVVRALVALLKGDERGAAEILPHRSRDDAAAADGELQDLPSPVGRLLFPTAQDLADAVMGGAGPVDERESGPALRIEVVHGDLKGAGYPVVVGHYDGATLKGAEAALDNRMGGALRDRYLLGVYPGSVGTAEIVLGGEGDQPPGAIIIGLGEIGDITPTKIARSVTQMGLRYALLALQRAQSAAAAAGVLEPSRVAANLSTLLIGTTGINSLNVVNSMAAVVKGILAANRLLEQRNLGDRVRIERVQFVELYEDLAVEATHVAHSLTSELGADDRVKAAEQLITGVGGLPGRPQLHYDEGQWRRVEVETLASPDGKRRDLTFTTTGSRARAEQAVTAGQRELIDELIAEAVNNPHPKPQVHNTLYELLLPNTMKSEARQTDNLLFVLDQEAANYPWELLASRAPGGSSDVTPLSTEVGLLRRLKTPLFRENVQTASGLKALVIGDPDPGTGLPELPGARQEANEVAALLTNIGYDVTALIRTATSVPSSLQVINALFRSDYRIIHIAAHGHYNPLNPAESGVVIGPGRYLSPLLLRQIQAMPALVFLNCCHLGQVGSKPPTAGAAGQFHLFAASVSQQLIQDGVQAVVAAGWAVDDTAARQFAGSFYENLLRAGRPFGDAIQAARSKVYEDHGTATNTWGAYQCYGDPGFSLVVAQEGEGERGRIVARAELLARARDLERAAESAEGDDVARIKADIDDLVGQARDEWMDGPVAYVIGNAYSGVGEFELAIEFHRKSKSRWGDGRAFRLLRVLANNESRHAAELHFDPPPEMDAGVRERKIQEYLDEAQTLLRALVDVAPDAASVHAHYASHAKRMAHIKADDDDGEVSREALGLAERHYRTAHDLARQQGSDIYTWPAMNWAALRCLDQIERGQPDDQKPPLDELLEECRQAAARIGGKRPKFWHTIVEPDAALYAALAAGHFGAEVPDATAEAHIRSIVELYERTLQTPSNVRFRRSVVEQIWFLAHMLRHREAEHRRLLDVMDRVQRLYALDFVRVPRPTA